MQKIKSEQFSLIDEDIKKAIFNSFLFGAPLLLMILIELQKGSNLETIKALAIAWVLQASIDLVKKFIQVNSYAVK